MTADRTRNLRIAVVLLGTESGGIRTFLLNQQAHAAEVAIDFDYIALQDGSMCEALRAGGSQVTALNVPLPAAFARAPVTAVLQWLLPGRGFGPAKRKLREYLDGHRPDCLYSHFLHNHLVCGVVGRELGLPRIGQVHGTINPRRSLGLTRIGYSLALSRSLDTIVMISNTAAGSLSPFACRKARTVYNGINAQAVESAATGVAKISGKLIILGRIVPGKKTELAIRALRLVMDAGMDCTLDVVGGPLDDTNDYAVHIRNLARELKVDHCVTFTGPISPPYQRLAAAEVCVNCSTVEGLSYVVMESFLCQTPIIVADQGAPTEIVQHEQTGLHYKADDPASLAAAIIRLLRDASLRARLADAALVYARRTFDISTHMRSIRAVFDDTIKPLSLTGRGAGVRVKGCNGLRSK